MAIDPFQDFGQKLAISIIVAIWGCILTLIGWTWRTSGRVLTLENRHAAADSAVSTAFAAANERHEECAKRTTENIDRLYELTRGISNSVSRIEGILTSQDKRK